MSHLHFDLVLENRNYNYDSCYKVDNEIKEIEKIDCDNLSYNDFFWNFMKPNKPVIIKSVSKNWSCRCNWVETADPNNGNQENISYSFLKEKIGNVKVPVADCSTEYFDSHAKCELNFYDYLDYWEQRNRKDGNANDKNLYLKDWHLKANMSSYDFYEVPIYFASDWLNEYLIDNKLDDYRFVYMGPKGTWTPFHADVFSSFSWSTNIVGAKKWILLLPNEENKLLDSFGNLPFTINETDLLAKNTKFISITQYENESIFVPSGWYHQVHNVADTISVNHNWFNGCNLENVWNSLRSNLQKVVAEILDCRHMENFEDHCQTMLKASFGMNYIDFLNILQHINSKRKQCCRNDKSEPFFDKFTPNKYHVQFDLQAIRNIVNKMKSDKTIRTNMIFFEKCQEIENE